MPSSSGPERYSALIDIDTHALLSVGPQSVVTFLTEAIPNTVEVRAINYPNYIEGDFFALKLRPIECPKWIWESEIRTLTEADPRFVTEELVSRAILSDEKSRAINRIMRDINLSRTFYNRGTLYQFLIYQEKKSEAERLKAADYRVEKTDGCPYISRYAASAGISVKEATDRILAKAKDDTERFAKTEDIRVTFFDKIKKAKNSEEVQTVAADFSRFHSYEGLF